MNSKAKNITAIAMLCAVSYVVMVFGRFPVVLFLKYDPKDAVIALGGLIWGPMTSCIVSVIVSFLEMLSVSETGIIGCMMNIISSCSFACTASVIYKRKRTLTGAVIGLAVGGVTMAAVMMLWNYLVTPLYMGYPRETVAKLLIPAFLPFNLLKSGLNGGFTFLLYKPVITALRKGGYVTASVKQGKKRPERMKHFPVSVLQGIVIYGRGIGKLVGMPTANLKVVNESDLPEAGVYISKVMLDSTVYYGITHIGTRPTIDNDCDLSVETHILNFNKEIYGNTMEIQLYRKIRSPLKFDNLSLLLEQIRMDCLASSEFWGIKPVSLHLHMDIKTHSVKVDNQQLSLSKKEFDILYM